MSGHIGFNRYYEGRPIGGCPRCDGPLMVCGQDVSCLCCGWAGDPTPDVVQRVLDAAKQQRIRQPSHGKMPL